MHFFPQLLDIYSSLAASEHHVVKKKGETEQIIEGGVESCISGVASTVCQKQEEKAEMFQTVQELD